MNARRTAAMLGLELYALMLACAQHVLIGLRSEEAMHLLGIFSAHPPLARFLLSLFDGWAYQEIFWRIVFATLLVQAVWLVLDLSRDLARSVRISVAVTWLFSVPVVLQAGTVTMTSLTAVQGLLFVWLLLSGRDVARYAWGIGLLWMASLFTAYQALLFAPVVWGALRSQDPAATPAQRRMRLGIWLVPMLLLGLFALTHPLALMDMVSQVTGRMDLLADRSRDAGRILLLGGSGILSVTGIIGLLLARRWVLLQSFLLIFAYIVVLGTDGDALLLLPLLIAGLSTLAHSWRWVAIATAVLVFVGSPVWCRSFFSSLPARRMDPASVLGVIGATDRSGVLLIAGPFGYEWQYASELPVRRYAARRLSEAAAVVCLQPCEEMERQERWERITKDPVEVWRPLR